MTTFLGETEGAAVTPSASKIWARSHSRTGKNEKNRQFISTRARNLFELGEIFYPQNSSWRSRQIRLGRTRTARSQGVPERHAVIFGTHGYRRSSPVRTARQHATHLPLARVRVGADARVCHANHTSLNMQASLNIP
eukprot:scaffold482852_cov46-Prasinocladus_malaysianus.AAC.3